MRLSEPREPSFTAPPRFHIVRRIGAGGMGVVYEAIDRDRDLRVALKHLAEPSAATLYLFKREFHALAGITHPNLVPLYELISDGQQWFFTMELLDEATDFLTHVRGDRPAPTPHFARGTGADPEEATALAAPHARAKEPQVEISTEISTEISVDVAVAVPAGDHAHLRRVFAQLATGVAALHRAGKLHRDLKPSNAMVRKDGRVVLVDFGLVLELREHVDPAGPAGRPGRMLTPDATDAQIAGSVAYMAPEQAAGEPLSEASDWYAVGVMLFEALTGRLPIEGPPLVIWNSKQLIDAPAPSRLLDGVPPDLDALCVALLSREPGARPSGAEVVAQLAGKPSVVRARPKLAPFVGRASQLAQLHRAFDEADQGGAVVCRVIGKSGAGKTALVHRFIDELAARRAVTVLAGRCYEQESVPYKMVDNVVDALASHLVRMPPDDAATLAPDNLPALLRVFPIFERVSAWAGAAPGAESQDPRALRQQAFAELRALLVRVSSRRPLLVYIDDVQWGDVDGASLLSGLLTPRDDLRVLVVLAYRSEEEAQTPCLAALAASPAIREASQVGGTITVDALTGDETWALALELIGRDRPDAAARAAWVVRESLGNALFIHELVRHLDSGEGAIDDRDALPLDDVLWRRVCRLAADARALVEIVSVAGQPIRLRDAQAAAGVPALPPEVVTGLRADQLVRGSGPSLDDDIQAFHDRIRESVVAHLADDTRRAHHRRLASCLEGHAAPETLAGHFLGAGELARASEHYVAAADLAVRALAFARAEGFYRQAVELAQTDAARADVWEKMIHYYTNMARFADAYAVAREAVQRFGVSLPAKFVPPLFAADLARAAIRMRGRAPESLLELPTASDERVVLAVRLICAVSKAAYQLRPELCVAIALKVVRLCLRHGNTRDCAIGYLAVGVIFLGGVLGRHETGHAFGQLSLAVAEKYDNPAQHAELAFVVGYFGTSWLRPATEAEALWRSAYASGLRTGDLFHTGCACAGMVMSLMMRGVTLDAVRDESERHVELLDRRGLREPLAVLISVRRARAALGEAVDGETPCAEDALDDAELEQRLAQLGSKHFTHFHHVLTMQISYLRGDHVAAAAAARASEGYLKESPGLLHSAEHEVWSALIAAAQVRGETGMFKRRSLIGQVKRARARLAAWAAACPINFLSKERLVAGELARLRGDADDAVRCFDAAVVAAEAAGHLHIAALAHELAARVLATSPAATARLDAARRGYQRWGAPALAASLDSRL